MFGTKAAAHSIEVKNSNGVILYYNWINGNELAVTYPGKSYDSNINREIGDLVIPESVEYEGNIYKVTSIGNDAFNSCKSLTSVVIPNSVTSIESHAFEYCGLKSVIIPNSVTSIDSYAFYGSVSLTSVIIGSSVTSIGKHAFSGCKGLNSVTIGNNVTSIGNDAFHGCSSLTSVTMMSPSNLISIGNSAFSGCEALGYFKIRNSVTSIGDWAFEYCSSLSSISIPDEVKTIGNHAFLSCSNLKYVTIGSNVESIGTNAFYGCKNLTSVAVYIHEPLYIQRLFTFSNSSRATLYVPSGSVEAYENHYGWRAFKKIDEIRSTKPGDANNDTEVDNRDINATAAYITENKTEDFIFRNADLDVDQKITIVDIVKLLNIILDKNGRNSDDANH